MTTPPTEPVTATVVRQDWRHDAGFRPPARVPWSDLGPSFAETFGRADPHDPQPEHIAIYGQNGTGKTHAAGIIYQERAFVTGRPSIIAAHKPVDKTLLQIGFPIVSTWDELVRKVRDGYTNVIFWPRTRLMGHARAAWYDRQFTDLMDRLWASATPTDPADTDLVFDDVGFIERSLPDTLGRIEQFLREGRAPGFSLGLLKQRVQGGTRLEASETQWTVGFKPKDDDDLERWAQLFGARRDWMPVFRSLDRQRREFVIKHAVTQEAFISWMDVPLAPKEPPRRRRGMRELVGIGRRSS
jgi:hypothetical protein